MKVFMINSVCGIRSTGRICTDLADVLRENGHECEIAYGRECVPEKYRDISYRIGTEADVRSHALASRLFDCTGSCSKAATKRLIEYIRGFAPDVIHLHNIHGYYINIDILFDFLAKCGIPVLWTLHDCWTFTGHCAYFTSADCSRWKTGCHDCPQKRSYPASILKDASESNWQHKKKLFTSVKNMTFVTPSDWLAGLVKESFFGGYDVRVIPNGIDLETFSPTESELREKYGLEGKKLVLGVASSWDERKGLREFTELASLLDDDMRVVLIGLSEKQIRSLPENVLGFPATNNAKELAGIYTQADVFVNAGKEETMGLTTVEAMACGTPAVVSNLTAVPEAVTSQGGIVLDELTAAEIKKGVQKVLTMQLSPRENAMLYEKKNQYLRYLSLYGELCKAKV